MPRSASDFMDIYSAADSYDTWSRSHDDDETDSRTSEYSSRDHYRRGGGRRRLRTMDYLEEENSIIDSQGESSVSEIDGTRREEEEEDNTGTRPIAMPLMKSMKMSMKQPNERNTRLFENLQAIRLMILQQKQPWTPVIL